MSRYAGFGLILIAALVIGGCSNSEPEAPRPAAPTLTDAPSATAMAEKTPPADTPDPMATGELPGTDSPIAPSQPAERSPTVLGAIGRAVAGAVGASDDDEEPSEAPAYRPAQ